MGGIELIDQQEVVFVVVFVDVIGIVVDVFIGNWQVFEVGQQLVMDCGEVVGVVVVDIEDFGSFFFEGVQVYCEYCQFVRGFGCFEVVVGICIEMCWGIGVDFVYFVGVVWIGSCMVVVIVYVGGCVVIGLQVLQDLFGCIIQCDVQMVDQL